jgi:hypothetical protein
MKRTSLAILALSIAISTLAQNSGDLENQFYFRFGYSIPTSSYFGNNDDAYWDLLSKVGGTFELGSIFMINSAALADGLCLGINVDYAEFSYIQLKEPAPPSYAYTGVLKLSSKIGPSLSYSPASNLVFDLFVKAKIPWVAGIVTWFADGEVNDGYLAGPGIGVATGVNVRYRFLMFGFEFNSDRMKFESVDNKGTYFGNYSDGSEKTPMPGFNFTFGFSF